MVVSKEWDWEKIRRETWLKPSEESFYYAEKWRGEGRKGCLISAVGWVGIRYSSMLTALV